MPTNILAVLVCLLAVGACAGSRPAAVDPVGRITDAIAAGAKRVQIPAGVPLRVPLRCAEACPSPGPYGAVTYAGARRGGRGAPLREGGLPLRA